MSIHVLTIGWEDETRLLRSFNTYVRDHTGSLPERVLLVHGGITKLDAAGIAQAIAETLEESLTSMFYTVNRVEVDPHSAEDIYSKVHDAISGESEVYLNVSGGTKVMVVALMMLAMSHREVQAIYYGVPERYPTESKGRVTPEDVKKGRVKYTSEGCSRVIDMPKMFDRDLFERREVARRLMTDLGSRGTISIKDLEDAHRGINRSTIRYYLKTLEEAGYIDSVKKGNQTNVWLTGQGKIVASFLAKNGHLR